MLRRPQTSVVLQRVHVARERRFVELPVGHRPFVSGRDFVVVRFEVRKRDMAVYVPPRPGSAMGGFVVVGRWDTGGWACVSRETGAG